MRPVGSGYCIATCMHVTRSPRTSPSTLTYHSVPQIVQNTGGAYTQDATFSLAITLSLSEEIPTSKDVVENGIFIRQ